MSKTVIFLFCSACFIILFWVVFLMSIPKHGTVVYDCRLAEISPDYPIEVKEKCRKLSSGRL